MQIKADEISKIIEDEIQNYDQRVEMSETGTASIGIRVARRLCRKTKTTMSTSTPASKSVW